MKRILKSCSILGAAAALALSVPALAQQSSGQTNDQQNGQQQSGQQNGQQGGQYGHHTTSTTHTVTTTSRTNQMSQQQMDQQKAALKDRVNKALDDNKTAIDDFQNMSPSTQGQQKTRYDTLLKQVNDRRDKLQADLGVIDGATTTDWMHVKTTVNQDLNQFNSSARTVTQMTRTHRSTNNRTGVTNQQPSGSQGSQYGNQNQGQQNQQNQNQYPNKDQNQNQNK